MLTRVAMPSSEMRCWKIASSRASDRPTVRLRSALRPGPSGNSSLSGGPTLPTLAPGAMPVTSATTSSCAGAPYRWAPVGPTHRPIGTGEASTERISSTIRSSSTTATLRVDLEDEGLAAVVDRPADRRLDLVGEDLVEQPRHLQHVDVGDHRAGVVGRAVVAVVLRRRRRSEDSESGDGGEQGDQ